MPKNAKIVGIRKEGKADEKMYVIVDFDGVINRRGHDVHIYKNDVYDLKKVALKVNHPDNSDILQAIVLQMLCEDTGVCALHVECYQIDMEVSQARSVSDYVALLKSVLDSVGVELSPWGPQNLA